MYLTLEILRLLAVVEMEEDATSARPIIIALNLANNDSMSHLLPAVDACNITIDHGGYPLITHMGDGLKAQAQTFWFKPQRNSLYLEKSYIVPDGLMSPIRLAQFGQINGRNTIVIGRQGGKVHIWDRDTAMWLHSIDTGGIRGIAWNDASMMLATVSNDGITIWTPPIPNNVDLRDLLTQPAEEAREDRSRGVDGPSYRSPCN